MNTNDMRFDEQVAVITGAGGGLGKQYALLLASRGARIVVNDTGGSVTGTGSNIDAANAAAEEIRRQGGEAVADTNSVITLTHRDCPVSAEIYTVSAGHVARLFIGRTKGFYSPALSMEAVRDHFAEIRDDTAYTVPGGPADEMSELFATIMASQPD